MELFAADSDAFWPFSSRLASGPACASRILYHCVMRHVGNVGHDVAASGHCARFDFSGDRHARSIARSDVRGPQMGAFQTMQFNNVPRAPMQPMPATRPSTWPGAVADSPGIAPATNAAPNVNPYGPANGPPAGSGVTVWDPRGNYVVPPQTQTGGTMQNSPVAAAPGAAVPNGFNPPQNGYGTPPNGYSAPPNGYGAPQNNFNAPPGYVPPQQVRLRRRVHQ